MTACIRLVPALASAWVVIVLLGSSAPACCPAFPSGKPVVNADQTVILIWDPATKTQHFIRQASFKSEADDFGFLVPTPTPPELEESGNEAFGVLRKLTEPETIKKARPSGGIGCGCSLSRDLNNVTLDAPVTVLQDKLVAGFHAIVLETNWAAALVAWLKENGYTFSPEVEAWAKPYVEAGWKITSLKVAKIPEAKERRDVAASALRMSFRTDRPLFPYREPDPKTFAADLGARQRLLRIYFIGEAKYQGELTRETPWTGKVAWAGKIKSEDRKKTLELLKLPETTGPAEWWVTEFEDYWPYKVAPADVTFVRTTDQAPVQRPIIEYVSSTGLHEVMVYAIAAWFVIPPLVRRVRRRK